MKLVKCLFLGVLAMALCSNSLFAQENKAKEQKKVIIIKKSVDDEGYLLTEDINLEVAPDENFEWTEEDGDVVIRINSDGKIEKTVEVIVDGKASNRIFEFKTDDEGLDLDEGAQLLEYNIDEDNGDRKVHLKFKSDDSEEGFFEWQGEGDVPEKIKEKLRAKGLNMEFLNGEHPHIIHLDKLEKGAFMGVILGKKEKITEIIGEDGAVNRTTETEGDVAEGAVVLDIIEESPAAQAGLQKGDVIIEMDGKPVVDYASLTASLKEKKVGDKVNLVYTRADKQLTTEVTLGERADFPNSGKHKWMQKGNNFDFNDDSHFLFRSDDDTGLHPNKNIIIIKSMKIDDADEEGEVMDEEPIWQAEELPEVESSTLELDKVEIFPNPTRGEVQLQFEAEAVPTEIMVSDVSGKSVYKRNLADFDGKFSEKINLVDFPKGTLILQIKQADKIFTEKIVLQ
ncbi:MAG: hypothetical protein DHS20C18_10220 [Saprospiraceae bacterium]|nr:MAG: hypothetical protein DHS20C18_10220 [Saprospiraceae bacterium]